MSAGFSMPQRGEAYQPRASLWVCNAPDPRVLKERRITSDGHQTCKQPLCGVPSERLGFVIFGPRSAPWAGMRSSVGALNSVD